jgi:MYXO-CTERM domain-containing protein
VGHSFAAGSTSPTTTATDGGAETDGEAATSTTTGVSEIDPRYRAGDVGTGTTNLDITGLTNGTNYVVGVTAVDAFGNVGPISAVQCAQPAAVNDFWNTYQQDSKGAGAQGCALESPRTEGASYAVLGLAAAAAAFVRRVRRR